MRFRWGKIGTGSGEPVSIVGLAGVGVNKISFTVSTKIPGKRILEGWDQGL